MKKILLSVLCVSAFVGFTFAAATPTAQKTGAQPAKGDTAKNDVKTEPAVKKIKVACLGDVITQGDGSGNWPKYLGELLGERYEVKNFGKAGYNGAAKGNPWRKTMAYADSKKYAPDVVIWMHGTDDSQYWSTFKLSDSYANDISSLLNEYKALPSQPRIIVATCPEIFQSQPPKFRGVNAKILDEEVIPLIPAIAEKTGAKLVDIHKLTKNKDDGFIGKDGYHPTEKGYRRIAEEFVKVVKTPSRKYKVACLGDSITQGSYGAAWPALLQKALGEEFFEVKNYGKAGTNGASMGVPWRKTNLHPDSLAFVPDIVIWMHGTNDSTHWRSCNLADIYVEDVCELLKKYVQLPNKPKLIVATSPTMFQYVPAKIWGINAKLLDDEVIPRTRTIAEKMNAKLVDIYALTHNKEDGYIGPDGCHPSAKGHQRIADEFAGVIKELAD